MTEPKSNRVTMKSLRSQLMQAQDQLVALHEVLEELCDRQEAQSVWQIELSKQLLMCDPLPTDVFADSPKQADSHESYDANDTELSDATVHLEAVNDLLSHRKMNRRSKNLLDEINKGKIGKASIVVIPEKAGLH